MNYGRENVCNEIYGDIETKETGYSIDRGS